MTQENTNEIEVTIKKKVTLRGSGMDVLDILDLTKTNNNSVRLTLLVGNDDSKIEPEATTFGIKVDQLKFINDLVSVEIDFINALNFIFLLRNFAKSEVLVINFINYLMVTKMINFSINFLSLFMSFPKN